MISLIDFISLTCIVSTSMARKNSRSALRSSTAVEDYLERILELINSKGYARVVDIAAALKISQASVTNMVQRLDIEGLLKYEKYRGLILTTAGKSLARKIAQRHRILTDFFKLLGLDEALTAVLRRRPALRARLETAIA
jgi:Mn-dependent DtxR family transcriptional regulator